MSSVSPEPNLKGIETEHLVPQSSRQDEETGRKHGIELATP